MKLEIREPVHCLFKEGRQLGNKHFLKFLTTSSIFPEIYSSVLCYILPMHSIPDVCVCIILYHKALYVLAAETFIAASFIVSNKGNNLEI